jgi:hypothetical protein
VEVSFTLSLVLSRGPKRRRLFASDANTVKRYKAIADELYTQAFDPETVLSRLRAIEAEAGVKIPSYVFTLLKRLNGAAQYAEGTAAEGELAR